MEPVREGLPLGDRGTDGGLAPPDPPLAHLPTQALVLHPEQPAGLPEETEGALWAPPHRAWGGRACRALQREWSGPGSARVSDSLRLHGGTSEQSGLGAERAATLCLQDVLTVVVDDLRLCSVKPCEDIERRFCFEVVSPTK